MRSIQLQDMAMRDELTELFNRRFFFERLQQELAQASEFGHQLAVLMIDVDGLKKINDAFGHTVGDAALVSLAKLIVKCTRTADIAARLGGDEFGLIMPEATKRTALAVVERLSQALEVTPVYEPDGQALKLTVSVGISGFPWGGHTVDELMRRADTYLYAAKGARSGQADTQPALVGDGLAE